MNSQINDRRARTHNSGEAKYQYRVSAWRTADGAGLAKCELAPNALHFAAPPEFGGLQGRWTPETLLLAAVAGCFTTTFQAIAGYSNLAYTDLEVEVEGTISKSSSGYAFTEIRISPVLTIPETGDQNRASELLRKVKALCLVSRALSVEEKFEPKVEIGEMATVG
jgi:organic hydroperoxide reductase OsmC/OhrA